MKKIIYIALFAMICTASFTACTEEEVKPNQELENGGTNGSDPIK